MSSQQTDYADWLRVQSSIIPTPFVSEFGYVHAGPYAPAPSFVGPWPSLQILASPTGVAQSIAIEWHTDAAKTHTLGGWRGDVQAGGDLAQVLRNRGPYVSVTVTRNGAGNVTGDLWMAGSTVTSEGSTAQGIPWLINQAGVTIGALGNTSFDSPGVYPGWAYLTAHTDAANWRVQLFSIDYAGTTRYIYDQGLAVADVNVPVLLPPTQIRATLRNGDAANRVFNVTLTPTILG